MQFTTELPHQGKYQPLPLITFPMYPLYEEFDRVMFIALACYVSSRVGLYPNTYGSNLVRRLENTPHTHTHTQRERERERGIEQEEEQHHHHQHHSRVLSCSRFISVLSNYPFFLCPILNIPIEPNPSKDYCRD